MSLTFSYNRVVTMIDKGEGTDMMYPEHFQGLMPGDRRETRNTHISEYLEPGREDKTYI